MTAGDETGALFYCRDLAAEIGDAMGRTGIGGRGEEPDDAMLANEVAGGIETFHANIIEVDAPMDASMDIRLGNDQWPRLLQKRHYFRRNFEELSASLEHAQFA